MISSNPRCPIWGVCVLFTVAPLFGQEKPAEKIAYDTHVKPIFKAHCVSCHNPERPRGDLDLTSFAGVRAGGTSGKVAIEGKPDDSLLYLAAAHLADPKMPPGKPKIPQREIDLINKWISGGMVEKKANSAANVRGPKAAVAEGLNPPTPFQRPSPVRALAVSPKAPIAAVVGQKQVLVFDLATNKLLGGLPFPEGEVHALKFSVDGTVLVAAGGVGGQSGRVVGFEVSTWKRLFAVGDEADAILAVDISPDKSRVAFGGPGRVVKILSVPDGRELHVFRKPTEWVLSVGFSPEGLLVAAGDRFGGLFVWEAKSGKEFCSLQGHTKAVTGIAWLPSSDSFVSCSEDRSVRLWNMHTGAESAHWDAHDEGVLDVAFHSALGVATAGRDGKVKVWDLNARLKTDFAFANEIVMKVAFTSDAQALIAGDWSGALFSQSAAGGKPARLPLPVADHPRAAAAIPVPTPAAIPVISRPPVETRGFDATDLARKQDTLKSLESAAEKLKEQAARNPKNPALAKAYLRVCEAVLAVKTEVLEAEAAEKRRESK